MNDFTKEELESIANWGNVYTEFGCSWSDKIERPLINKVQSMIDNYCKHEFIVFNKEYNHVECIKCGVIK